MKVSLSSLLIFFLMGAVAVAAGAALIANLISVWEMIAIEFGWS